MARFAVALVFHHHQPLYLDEGGRFLYPWVFTNSPRYLLHLRELEEHSDVTVTFNIQATLLEQWHRASRGFVLIGQGGSESACAPSSAEARACAYLLAGYRAVARRRRAEFLTSPFHHPIMPILVDRGYHEDLRWHLREGMRTVSRYLGNGTRGLWVPEMAFSEGALNIPEVQQNRHTVLDGRNLARVKRRVSPYKPYRRGGTSPLLLLRDTELSNAFAFRWSSLPSGAVAAKECMIRLRALRRRGYPYVVLALDGENWITGNGLLHHLYRLLAAERDLETMSLSELPERMVASRLGPLPTWSWGKSGDLSTWMGSPAKDMLWTALDGARRELVRASREMGGRDPDVTKAWRCLYAAEGSDYTYWDSLRPGPLTNLGLSYAARAEDLAKTALGEFKGS